MRFSHYLGVGGGVAPKGSRAQLAYAVFPPQQLKNGLSLSPHRGALPKAIEFFCQFQEALRQCACREGNANENLFWDFARINSFR